MEKSSSVHSTNMNISNTACQVQTAVKTWMAPLVWIYDDYSIATNRMLIDASRYLQTEDIIIAKGDSIYNTFELLDNLIDKLTRDVYNVTCDTDDEMVVPTAEAKMYVQFAADQADVRALDPDDEVLSDQVKQQATLLFNLGVALASAICHTVMREDRDTVQRCGMAALYVLKRTAFHVCGYLCNNVSSRAVATLNTINDGTIDISNVKKLMGVLHRITSGPLSTVPCENSIVLEMEKYIRQLYNH